MKATHKWGNYDFNKVIKLKIIMQIHYSQPIARRPLGTSLPNVIMVGPSTKQLYIIRACRGLYQSGISKEDENMSSYQQAREARQPPTTPRTTSSTPTGNRLESQPNTAYNPVKEASVPVTIDLWERKANPLFSPCPTGQGNASFKRPLEVGSRNRGNYDTSQAITGMRKRIIALVHAGNNGPKPCKQGLTRVGHLAWIKEHGLPDSTRRLQTVERELKGCKEEIELLDVQILAIGSMHGAKALL